MYTSRAKFYSFIWSKIEILAFLKIAKIVAKKFGDFGLKKCRQIDDKSPNLVTLTPIKQVLCIFTSERMFVCAFPGRNTRQTSM